MYSFIPDWVGDMDHYDFGFLREKGGFNGYIDLLSVCSIGCDTEDQVFLLSIQEVKKYFSEKSGGKKCVPTSYAIRKGARPSRSSQGAFWWLRSGKKKEFHAATVTSCGYIFDILVNERDCMVRPAMWVKKDYFK